MIRGDFTVETLAEGSGLDKQTIRRVINCKDAKLSNAKAICKALNKSLDDIFGGDNGNAE